MKDVFGKALLDYQNDNYTEEIITWTSISGEDTLPLPYLFRDYSEMPLLEQKALQLCRGTILDVGCGAGSHSLYLQNNGFSAKGIDVSEGAVDVCKRRGLTHIENKAILNETKTFDTILLLMNGTGIFNTLNEAPKYLSHLKSLLNPNGQILIDSSDIKYMYENEDGSYWIDANANYYGELNYFLKYKNEEEIPLKWLYLDFNTLTNLCTSLHLKCELIQEGSHYDYLARISH